MLSNVHRRSIRGLRELRGLPSRNCLHGGWRNILINMHELCSRKIGGGGLKCVRSLYRRHLSTKCGTERVH